MRSTVSFVNFVRFMVSCLCYFENLRISIGVFVVLRRMFWFDAVTGYANARVVGIGLQRTSIQMRGCSDRLLLYTNVQYSGD